MASIAYQPFPETHWSLVRRAGTADADARRQALATLLTRYRPALLSYLRFVKRLPPDEAEEILQAFIADQFLERQLAARADPARGRFRTFLLTSLNHFVTDHRSARTPSLELPPTDRAAATPSPDIAVEAAWARALVHDVLQTMRDQCTATGRTDLWSVFEGRILAEIFGVGPTIPYDALAEALQLASPTQAANLLVTAKRMYARLLRTAVGEYEPDPDAVDAEITDLHRILAAAGGPADDPSHAG